ncbi:MAG: hypothetical protein MZV70_35655 [Desulfobacterales bacterium]|nr:hypothetical protein [Desulfobacterales bacterium]
MEAARGRILYERDADIPIPPASLTKLMTLRVLYKEFRRGPDVPGRRGHGPARGLRPALQLQPDVPPALHESSGPGADAGPCGGIRE